MTTPNQVQTSSEQDKPNYTNQELAEHLPKVWEARVYIGPPAYYEEWFGAMDLWIKLSRQAVLAAQVGIAEFYAQHGNLIKLPLPNLRDDLRPATVGFLERILRHGADATVQITREHSTQAYREFWSSR